MARILKILTKKLHQFLEQIDYFLNIKIIKVLKIKHKNNKLFLINNNYKEALKKIKLKKL